MTALITGASSGIGLDLARVCARQGHDVVLVARSENRLRALAQELTAMGVRAEVLVADLATADAARQVVDVLEARGVVVDLLINNAGFGLFGPFVETSLAAERSMILLNVLALTELTKHLLPGMVARRRGRVLNVASVAAFYPGPLMAVYYATKAYVVSFSQALANEVGGTGVTVTAFCPGPTVSGFEGAAGLEGSRLFKNKRLPGSAEVAEAGYRAMMAGDVLAVPGLQNRLSVFASRLVPRRLAASVIRRVQAHAL